MSSPLLSLEETGLIYNARQRPDGSPRPADERIAYFTSLFHSTSGAWLAGCQIGAAKHGPGNSIRLSQSDDDGRTWRELPARFATRFGDVPGSLAAAEVAEPRPGEWRMFCTWFDRSDPSRPLFDPVTEGILRCKQLTCVSRDAGRSWCDWSEIPTPGLTGCAICGPPVQWPDGTLAFAFESFKEFDDPSPPRHAAWLLVSRDGGSRFDSRHLVAQDPQQRVYFWDQRLCAAGPSGEYLALFWTHDRAAKHDLRVHLKRGSLHDAGNSELPVETTIPGQIAAPLVLNDGRWLAFVVDRARPATMTLWISEDQGHTWPVETRLVVYNHDERAALSQGLQNIDFGQYWEDMGKWTFGHPAIRHLSDRRVLLAWYAGAPDALSLHWARVAVT